MTRVRAVCEYVQDGDTFRTAGKNWIRLANVRAPDKNEPEFLKAKSILEKLILNRPIVYERVTSYNRVVAEVWVGSINVNTYMQEQGYA